MAAVKSHIRLLREMRACSAAIFFAEQFPSLKAAWKACPNGNWMLWFIAKSGNPAWGMPEHRKIVGVACRCARLAEKHWTDACIRDAVALAERYAAGEQIAQADLRAAATAATAAAANSYAANSTINAAAAGAALPANNAASYAAAAAAANARDCDNAIAYATYAAAAVATETAAVRKQCVDIVREAYPVPPTAKGA